MNSSPNKKATVSFRHRGQFKRFTLTVKDRQAAMAYVKAYYSGATDVSIVFFVPYQEGV